MNKHLVLEISNNREISNLVSSTIQDYAKRIGADHKRISGNDFEKVKVIDFFRSYHRILLLDSFLIIREDAPDMFQVVPKEKLGVFNEGKYVNKLVEFKNLLDAHKISTEKWKGEYYDTGVVIASRIHKDLFDVQGRDFSFEDYFNLKIYTEKPTIHELSYRHNHIHYVDAVHGMPRHSSFVIHYKGAPDHIADSVIRKDLDTWKADSPEFSYKRTIVVSVSAGMGDQLCSEPAIRYMQKLYPESEIIVVTHFPRLFEHLGCEVHNHDDWNGVDRTVLVMHTCPDDTQAKHPFSHVLFHPTDFASMSMYRMTIPNHEKTIKLEVDPKDLESMENFTQSLSKPLVLVHPGKWWPSKTFTVEWWQRVIDLLAEHFTVGLIGKTISEEQGYLPVECPEDGIDFRDSTTLGELIALISKAPVLLTNDSSPLHIAGAFDNWVVVIPTAKHQDHILPYRNGTQYYKTKALCKKVLMQDLELRATEIDLDTINLVPEGKTIYDYLPEPQTVVKEILSVFEPEEVKQKELCV
jgi:ADP-heptose:LPS heptosyltransferase